MPLHIDRELLRAAAAAGAQLSGSLTALPREQQLLGARELVQSIQWVHADMIEGSFAAQRGVQPGDLPAIAAIPDARLDVHVMSDDPVETARRIAVRPHRLTVQLDGRRDAAEVLQACAPLAGEVWGAIEHGGIAEVRSVLGAGASGILVMLVPPGRPGYGANLERLRTVQAAASLTRAVGVDGGVNVSNIAAVVEAGARHVVAGRGLISFEDRHDTASARA